MAEHGRADEVGGVVRTALDGVPRRPPRPLYQPSWMERRFGWASDLVARLDPEPLGRWWHTLSEPVTAYVGRAMEPIANGLSRLFGPGGLGRAGAIVGSAVGTALWPASRGLDRLTRAAHEVSEATDRTLEALVVRAPVPHWFRRAFWIPPFDTPPSGTRSAQMLIKSDYASVVWSALILSVVIHGVAFSIAPDFDVEDVSFVAAELEAVEIPPEIEVPPPPRAIARPATPVISSVPMDEEVTIAVTTFEENPVERLPPPPPERTTSDAPELDAAPTFTPFTVAPEIRNRRELAKAIGEHYPPHLRDAGIGGVVVVWFYIDETGKVTSTRVAQSSGFPQLDEAALTVSDLFVFSPALNNDQNVPVWVQFPITFEVR